MSDPTLQEVRSAITENVQALFAKVVQPSIEKWFLDQAMAYVEKLVEKKVEERFAFAIQLLHEMGQKEEGAK